jgi:ketosteroid isomerase-like protein
VAAWSRAETKTGAVAAHIEKQQPAAQRDTAKVTSANVELVRSIYAAWGQGDYSSAEWADPEIEFVQADGPERGSWTGLAAMAEAWRRNLSAFEDHRVEAEECHELDHERVIVLDRRRGRGKRSGIELTEMQSQGASVFHIRGGKVVRLVIYGERAPALNDVGLAADDARGGRPR